METQGIKCLFIIQCGLLKILTEKIQTNGRRSIHFGWKNVDAHVPQVAASRNGFRTVVPFEWAPLRIYKTLFMGLSVWKHWA
jgi:hypothetical protein